jgi:hypothetical protein
VTGGPHEPQHPITVEWANPAATQLRVIAGSCRSTLGSTERARPAFMRRWPVPTQTEVIITVRYLDGKLRLPIEHNGNGFDRARLNDGESLRGWRVATMRERALAVQGTFRVCSRLGLGTHVLVEATENNHRK